MKIEISSNTTRLAAVLGLGLVAQASAQTIVNGGFESGFTGWTRADQIGSDGTFFNQTGLVSPVNAFDIPAPPEGTHAAMTDSGAGGSHVLYQDFTVPASLPIGLVRFSLFLNNGAETYFFGPGLDWAATNQAGGLTLNQQARVDIISTTADPFSTAAADVLANLYSTTAATPAVTGYNAFEIDLTAFFQAHAGETLRLRFAEVDNVNFFNFGVDNVGISFIPAPSTAVAAVSMMGLMVVRRRRVTR